MIHTDILIVGAGIGGIAAAKEAVSLGARVILADKNPYPGGILPQCTHRGFSGSMTGPEYLEAQLRDFPFSVDCRTDTTVLSVGENRTARLSSRRDGIYEVSFTGLILATGCWEIPAGALMLGGTRPSGVYTAGHAQKLCNLEGVILPDPIVILGSGDVGLIMAAQLAEKGRNVAAVIEKKETCGGLQKNRAAVQRAGVPVYTDSVIRSVEGYPALSGVTVSDGQGTRHIPCKTLLIAAGLRPDTTLIRELGFPPWLRLCGNCSRIHTMADSVAADGKRAAASLLAELEGLSK